jgi:type VI secretion system secreted protein VgrG
MSQLQLTVASGDEFSIRRFSAQESVSALFTVSVWARASNAEVDLESVLGKEASLHVVFGTLGGAALGARLWKGVCAYT